MDNTILNKIIKVLKIKGIIRNDMNCRGSGAIYVTGKYLNNIKDNYGITYFIKESEYFDLRDGCWGTPPKKVTLKK